MPLYLNIKIGFCFFNCIKKDLIHFCIFYIIQQLFIGGVQQDDGLYLFMPYLNNFICHETFHDTIIFLTMVQIIIVGL